MQDLLLFRLLVRKEHDDERLPGLLEELANETLRERTPFFGPLVTLASDDRVPEGLRRRALAALRGATGLLTTETATEALEQPTLALDAVCLLAVIAKSEPARWAHVVFHAAPAVRAAGLALSRANDAPRTWDLCLAADPELREIVLGDATSGALEPPGGVAVLVDLLRAGMLPPEAAWKILEGHPALLGQHTALRYRQHSLLTRFLATAPTGPDFSILEGTADEIDVLLGAIPGDIPETLERTLAPAVMLGQALATSAWLDVRRRGPTPSRLQIIARFDPASLRSPSLSHEAVRTAAKTYVRSGVRGRDAEVDALLTRAVLPDGRVDLFCAGAFLRLCDKKPYARLLGSIDRSLLTVALVEEPIEDVALLLSLNDEDDAGRQEIKSLVPLSHAKRTRADVLAALAIHAPESLLGFVAGEPELTVSLKTAEIAKVEGDRAAAFAKALVERHGPEALALALELGPGPTSSLGRAVIDHAALALATEAFVAAFSTLEPGTAERALAGTSPGSLPLGKERALAEHFRGHAHPGLAAWSEARVAPAEAPPPPVAARQRQGVAYRPSPASAPVEACVALLGSLDPVAATDEAFAKASSASAAFVEGLDAAMVDAFAWSHEPLSPLGHAWLWRWDAHALAHLERGLEEHGSLSALVRARLGLVSPLLRARAIAAIASALGVLSMRERPRYLALVDDAALEAFVDGLRGDASLHAATALRHVARARSHDLGPTIRAVRLVMPDLAGNVREVLAPLVEADGLPARREARVDPKPDEALVARIRSTTEIEALVRWTNDDRLVVVHEATLRLVEMGERGVSALADRIGGAPSADRVRPIIESISLWPDGPGRAQALSIVKDATRPLDVRFRVALAAIECGVSGAADLAVAIACEPCTESFFEPRDWDALARVVPLGSLAVRLAPSPQPHAYIRSVEHLLAGRATEEALRAIRAFLDQGARRMGPLRRRAAMHLHENGDEHGFVLVLGQCLEETSGRPHLFDNASAALSRAAAMTFLAAGNPLAKEAALVHHLSTVPAHVAEDALEALLTHGTTDKARMAAARLLSTRAARERKLLRIAEVFAWGSRIAQRALGKPMRIRMTGTQKLGFTRTRENAIFVTPLPILRGDPHGQEVVAALILHELGHHLYHAGPAAEKVWKRAENAGLHGVLNLVADEHLERNLRAIDARWGDLLKRLAAYAFQHTDRTVPVLALVSHLGARAFDVLSRTRLEPARDDKSVKVDSGSLLFTMERAGLSFARFARALRMGLGNRHADPRVEQALALFASNFRQGSMEDLWKITLQLKEIFGFETRLAESIGPHEELDEGGVEGLVWNDGITQEDIDRVVDRVVTGEGGTRGGTGKPSGRLYLNVDPETKFDLIREVRPVAFDAAAYAPYKRKVDRPAAMLRQYLEELGLSYTDRRLLVSGRRVDRPRLLPLALHGDPRAMRSRETKPHRDLYLGLVVDCSGSMATRENIERAKLFGALITEAARPLSEVDVRVFGFTDRVIFDCGPKDRCAVHALAAGGGNNDSAALYHAATQAKGSRRKAKVLVMISDGLPTECSVASLKHLVTHLTRREGMIVAQVAVQPLAERCFPHYVVLTDASIEATVRKFGGIIASLVQKAMGR